MREAAACQRWDCSVARSPPSQGIWSLVSSSTSPFIFLYHRKHLPFPQPHLHPLKHQLKLQERQRLAHPPRPKPGAKQAGCKEPSLPALRHQRHQRRAGLGTLHSQQLLAARAAFKGNQGMGKSSGSL